MILSQSQQTHMSCRSFLLFPSGNGNGNGNGVSYIRKNIMINSGITNYSSSSIQFLSTTSKLAPIQCSSSSRVMATPPASITNGAGWAEFAKNVSGEWDGFGADFTVQGKPIELPESVVPEAYREWEVKVFDWQTQCPTLADPDNLSFKYKLIRLLPTVGCEADAATRYTVDERTITTTTGNCTAFAYQPGSGCYVAAWSNHNLLLELEHCLIDPRDRESRVRIVQFLTVFPDGSERLPELQSVKVFREQWYGPFRDGDQLGGCAIRDSAFASTPPLDASHLIGVWDATSTFLNSPLHRPKSFIQEVVQEKDCARKTVRDTANLVLLPKQLWCSLKDTQISGETCCEAGWLLDKGTAITSKCILSNTGELKEIAIAYEQATSESV